MSTPNDPTGPLPADEARPAVDPTVDTSPAPAYDPTTGYAVPSAPGGTASTDQPGGDVPPGTWGAAPAAPPAAQAAQPAPAAAAGPWFRQPWAIAVFVLAGVLALGASFTAGFATRSALDRAIVDDRLAGDRAWDRGDAPGMGPQGGYGDRDGGHRGPQGGFGDRDGAGPDGDGPLPQATPTTPPTATG